LVAVRMTVRAVGRSALMRITFRAMRVRISPAGSASESKGCCATLAGSDR